MLTTFSARPAPEATRGLAARGWPRRGESAAKPTAPGAPYGAWGAPKAPPVGFAVRFRIALAGRALQIYAPGPGVGFGVVLGWIWAGFGMDMGWIWDGFGVDLR